MSRLVSSEDINKFEFLKKALQQYRQSNEAITRATTTLINTHHKSLRCFFGKCPIIAWEEKRRQAKERISQCEIVEDLVLKEDFLSALTQVAWFFATNNQPTR